MKQITSRDNPRFKQLAKLAESAKERRQTGQTLLDGVHLIEAYNAKFGVPQLLIIPEGKSSAEALHLMQTLNEVEMMMLPTLMFAELSPVAHSTGLLALVAVPEAALPETPQHILLLENIQDPGNLGSLLRTAAAAGVDAVYCSLGCTDAWSPKALRGGQGAQFVLPVTERADLLEVIKGFNAQMGAQSLVTTMQGASLYSQDLSKPTAWIFGNEGAGVSAALIRAASAQVHIPMIEGVESLNVAAAVAVCLFERARQINTKASI